MRADGRKRFFFINRRFLLRSLFSPLFREIGYRKKGESIVSSLPDGARGDKQNTPLAVSKTDQWLTPEERRQQSKRRPSGEWKEKGG